MEIQLKCILKGREHVLQYLRIRKRLGMTDEEFITYALHSLMKRIDAE